MPHDHETLFRFDVEREPIEHFLFLELYADITQFDHMRPRAHVG